jgi:hypothetical protein
MTRDIEIEISDQSNVIFFNILHEKKRDVQRIIDDLFSCSSNYIFIFVFYRDFISHERLQLKTQTSFKLFQLFFSFTFLEILTNNTHIKIDLKRAEVIHKQRSWTNVTSSEIEIFIEILLYMRVFHITRVKDYWNLVSKRSIHVQIIDCMIIIRWKQIKRYLKIFNSLNDQKIDTRDSHWWKKLKFLIIDFRTVSKRFWTSDSHVSINEQLIEFRERLAHTMQLVCKTAEVSFKLYSLCQKNYLIDFLFISKIWYQNMKRSDLKCKHFDSDN